MLLLPSRSYLKIYLWILVMFALLLLVLSYLFGRYLGSDVALKGGIFIALILVYVFGAVLIFAVLVNIADRDRSSGVETGSRKKGSEL